MKESFPGVGNSYLTLKTPKSVVFPFPGHSAGTQSDAESVIRVLRGYLKGPGTWKGHFVNEKGHGKGGTRRLT
jgi:hypothetical protein